MRRTHSTATTPTATAAVISSGSTHTGETPNGNFSLHPLFCPAEGDYTILSSSPCAPDNNDCGMLVGALGAGCSDIRCGDINGDGIVYAIADWVYLMRYVTGTASPVAPLENSDVDLCGNVNMSDIALYLEFFIHGMQSGMCQPHAERYLQTGGNEVALGCPLRIPVGEWDSVPLPIYITNDTALVALSLGFHFDSDEIEILSLDTDGSVLPADRQMTMTVPGDGGYIWPVPDSNLVLISGFRYPQGAQNLQAQEGGLLVTLWLRTPTGLPKEVVDFDSAFVRPAGVFPSTTHGQTGLSVAPGLPESIRTPPAIIRAVRRRSRTMITLAVALHRQDACAAYIRGLSGNPQPTHSLTKQINPATLSRRKVCRNLRYS